MSTPRHTLSPEMLLFEIAAMCSRHGLSVSSANPGAAVHHAARLLQALGLADPPAAIAAAPAPPPAQTTPLPVVRAPSVNVVLPRGSGDPPSRVHPLDRPTSFAHGRQRPGAPRSLHLAE